MRKWGGLKRRSWVELVEGGGIRKARWGEEAEGGRERAEYRPVNGGRWKKRVEIHFRINLPSVLTMSAASFLSCPPLTFL